MKAVRGALFGELTRTELVPLADTATASLTLATYTVPVPAFCTVAAVAGPLKMMFPVLWQ